MNRRLFFFALLFVGAISAASLCRADAVAGQAAPAFSLKDSEGHARSLNEFAGKYVVLEWFNPDCPFVRKHYGSGNMQRLQEIYTGKGVAWLSINSGAEGKQGRMTPEQAQEFIKSRGVFSTAVLLDLDGSVGKLYGAKTTPHMFVIDPQGVVIYAGAIDDKPSIEVEDVKTAKNYVVQALDESMAGKPVSVPQTKSYGCSVKY